MQKSIRILSVALAAQILLAIMTYSGSTRLATSPRGDHLLTFNPSQVDGIVIRGSNGAEVRLSKNDSWHLADGFPADGDRVTRLLDRLHDMKHGLAVATTPTAQARFAVATKKFERCLTLLHDKQPLAVMYLGRGAGARRSYVRADKAQAIYSVELGSYDLPVEKAAWQDKTVLQLEDITALESGGIRVEKRKGADTGTSQVWWSNKTPKGKQPDSKAIEHAVSLLETLRFTKVLGQARPDDYDVEHPVLSFSIEWKHGRRKYRFARHAKDDLYALKVSDRPEYFEIAGYIFDGLKASMAPEKWFTDIKPTQPERQGNKTQTPGNNSAG